MTHARFKILKHVFLENEARLVLLNLALKFFFPKNQPLKVYGILKQFVCKYLSKAKELQSAELNSAASHKSHRSRKSNHAGHSNLSSLSSYSKLTKGKTRVAALEVEVVFLKEKQALKMAEEQLELRKSLAKAKEEERIFEQMNNEELVSTPTCLQYGGPQLP